MWTMARDGDGYVAHRHRRAPDRVAQAVRFSFVLEGEDVAALHLDLLA